MPPSRLHAIFYHLPGQGIHLFILSRALILLLFPVQRGVAYNPSAFVYRSGNCHDYLDGGITVSNIRYLD